jgi:transposase
MSGYRLRRRERRKLEMQLRSVSNPLEYRRILTLLAFDKETNLAKVARMLNVSRRSIYRWWHRLQRNQSDSPLQDYRNRSGRPKSYTRKHLKFLAKVIRKNPQKFGYIETGWSIRLLQDYLAHELNMQVSESTLRRQLHSLNCAWTRFGYELAPDPELEKKTSYSPNYQTLR